MNLTQREIWNLANDLEGQSIQLGLLSKQLFAKARRKPGKGKVARLKCRKRGGDGQ